VAQKAAVQFEAELSGAPASDNDMVAAVVQRVMERLKPGLIEEIVREMKNKK
jgi:hypothetical protein